MSQIMETLNNIAADPHWQLLAADDPKKPEGEGGGGGPVPGFDPALPAEVNNPVKKILGWTAGLGLAGAVLGGLLGWAFVAVGHNTERAQLAARGKQGILWSLIGAGGIGVTSALVLSFYNISKGGN
ncbi:hypothetical protein OHS70_38360 (plasmid) [Streptomyces sp. NBC_00390]|uniref:hypothetical protein n=1 Tax=Streptomyces sp. NBC_00390 TaxID=2975736 RepID=UPI002E1D0F99